MLSAPVDSNNPHPIAGEKRIVAYCPRVAMIRSYFVRIKGDPICLTIKSFKNGPKA